MRRAARGLLLALVAVSGTPAPRAATPHCDHARQAQTESERYRRSVAHYAVPAVTLVDQDATRVLLPSLLPADAGVALTFVFTTCTTICPVLTSTVSRMRHELGAEAHGLRVVSISIDPDHDTPAALKEYATRFDTGPDWRFLTGDGAEVVRVLKAFDAFAGPKTNHQPLTLMRAPGRPDWVRIQGFATAAELAGEYRRLLAE